MYDEIASKTATSTRFSIELSTKGCCSGVAVRYWLESTPMTHFSASAAASNTPVPEPPAAWYTTSAPAS